MFNRNIFSQGISYLTEESNIGFIILTKGGNRLPMPVWSIEALTPWLLEIKNNTLFSAHLTLIMSALLDALVPSFEGPVKVSMEFGHIGKRHFQVRQGQHLRLVRQGVTRSLRQLMVW